MKRIFAVMGVLVALCIGLVGCGSTAAPSGEKFVDTWTVHELNTEDEKISATQMEAVLEAGNKAEMVVNADGTFTMNLLGDEYDGKWKAKSETEAVFKMEGSTVKATLDGDSLVLVEDETSMTFTRGAFVPSSTGSTSSDEPSSSDEPTTDVTEDLNVTAIDDGNMKLVVTGKGLDFEGDPTIYFTVDNYSNRSIEMFSNYATIDGKEAHCVIATSVDAGETLDDYMFFHSDDTGVTSMDQFKNISVDVQVYDSATGEELGTYTITLD